MKKLLRCNPPYQRALSRCCGVVAGGVVLGIGAHAKHSVLYVLQPLHPINKSRLPVMEDPELMIGPVAEALGVSRTWLLSSDEPLLESIDLPVSLMVELMDAADCLYPTEEQRWRQIRQWLSRLTGRPAAEFERAAPLMLALRRQFRLSRDEDLQAVTVWRRAQTRPAELSQLQLTVRPENGARLRRLVQQLGSEEAAIDFLLQMDDNCGKGAALRRTRWPPKVHYESSRGLVKIDVGTEMVCVVLSQVKPAQKAEPAPAPAPVPAPAPASPAAAVEVVSTPEVPVVNGHEHQVSAPPAAAPGQTAPTLSLTSAYQTVVRDATLPAQMFADDDLAADQLSEVQHQLTEVLDQLAEDSNQMAQMGSVPGEAADAGLGAKAGASGEGSAQLEQVVGVSEPVVGASEQVAVPAEQTISEQNVDVSEQILDVSDQLTVPADQAVGVSEQIGDIPEQMTVPPEQIADVAGELDAAADGSAVAGVSEQALETEAAAAEPVDTAEIAAEEMVEVPADVTEVPSDMTEVPSEMTEVPSDMTEMAGEMTDVPDEVTIEEPVEEAEVGEMAEVPEDMMELAGQAPEAAGLAAEFADAADRLVELPEQLMEPSPGAAEDEPMAEPADELMELAADDCSTTEVIVPEHAG